MGVRVQVPLRVPNGRLQRCGLPFFGFFWSASAAGTNTWRSLLGGDTEVYRAYDNQRFGISVRCVQD